MNIAKLVVALGLLSLLATGCSDGAGEGPAPFDTAPHPAGWLSLHAVEARIDTDSCRICHGLDYAGSGAAVSCFLCHPSGPPFVLHPGGWQDVRIDHQTFFANQISWTVCAAGLCHGTALQGGRGPSCFDPSGACHVNTAGTPPAPHVIPFTGPAQHGIAAKSDLLFCLNCHGRPTNQFTGGFVADLFGGTPAAEINLNGDCATCHPEATAHAVNWTRNSNAGGRSHATAGNLANSCPLCHNLTIDTTPGNVTAGPFAGAPSCFSSQFTNPNGITSGCHTTGPGQFHAVGDAWLLPAGHVQAAIANLPPCFSCHSLTAAGGGTPPACQDCHATAPNLVAGTCDSCHRIPPDGVSPPTAAQPNRPGAHAPHVVLNTPLTGNCSACHNGSGTGTLGHYDRVDQTTPDYPAEVKILVAFRAKSGLGGYDPVVQQCSNIHCHGGQPTPVWPTGAITVPVDCPLCHQLASVSDQYNSPVSGRHDTHVPPGGRVEQAGNGDNPTCLACHDPVLLPASGHFANLTTSAIEGDPVANLRAGLGYDNLSDPANPTCTTNIANCHPGSARIWGANAIPHAADGAYLDGALHGPEALTDLTYCQGCHGDPPTGRGPLNASARFNVGITDINATGLVPNPGNGCESCHNPATAHPSSTPGLEAVRWYDAVAGDPAVTPAANRGMTHNSVGGSAAAVNACLVCHALSGNLPENSGPDCLFCHVGDPTGAVKGGCVTCHGSAAAGLADRGRPNGSAAPNRAGQHQRGDHRFGCNICHTNSGPDSLDGTVDDPLAVNHFTLPTAAQAFSRANLRPLTLGSPNMAITVTPANVSCAGSCHGNENWY